MSSRKSRIARKAERATKTAIERKFDTELAALRRERDEANHAAHVKRDKEIAEAHAACTTEKLDIDDRYENARAKLLKQLADEEARAAA